MPLHESPNDARYLDARYLRISVDPDDDQLGVSRQRDQTAELAKRVGAALSPDTTFMDNDVSASKTRSPVSDWAACLEYVRTSRPRYLLGLKMDRLGRRLGDLEGLEELCRSTGTRVWTVAEGDVFANPAWPLLAAVAKMESRNTAARVQWAQDARRAAGKDAAGGTRPFGYDKTRSVLVPDEVAILREVAARIIAKDSARSICADLNDRGVQTTGGKRWNIGNLYRTMRNPRYAARLTHRGEVIGDAAWPEVFDLETWTALQAAVADVSKPRAGRPVGTLLGGLLRCGLCDARMQGTFNYRGRGRETYGIYRCSDCKRVSRKRETLDDYVVAETLRRISHHAFNILEAQSRAELDAANADLQAADAEIGRVREARHSGIVAPEDYYADLDALRRLRRKLETRCLSAQTRLSRVGEEADARTQWQDWGEERRRSFLRAELLAVIVHKPSGKGAAARVIRKGEVEVLTRNAH